MNTLLLRSALCVLVLAVLAGCNTIQGAGKDLKKAGEAVERAAERAKKG